MTSSTYTDGFRKVRSELPQQANFWEFKHPLFRRGDTASLSLIKKSAHFDDHSVDNQVANMSENVNELRSHVWTLNQRVSNLDSIVEDLSQSLRNLGSISNSTLSPSESQSQQIQAPVVSSSALKRKNSLNGTGQSLSLSRQSSLQIGIGDFAEEFWDFAATLSVEQLHSIAANNDHDHDNDNDINSNVTNTAEEATFSNSNSNSVSEQLMDLYGPNTSNASMNFQPQASASQGISSFMETDSRSMMGSANTNMPSSVPSALPFSSLSSSSPSNSFSYLSNSNYNVNSNSNSNNEGLKKEVNNNEDTAEVATAIRRSELLVDTVSLADIPSILQLLPASLQERFVDRLADAVGSRLPTTSSNTTTTTTAIATASTATSPVSTRPYWETISVPSAVPLSNHLSSQSSLLPSHTAGGNKNDDSLPQRASLWAPSVITPPAQSTTATIACQHTVNRAQRSFNTYSHEIAGNHNNNNNGGEGNGKTSPLTMEEQLAFTALASKFLVAAATVQVQGRLNVATATATVSDTTSAPSIGSSVNNNNQAASLYEAYPY